MDEEREGGGSGEEQERADSPVPSCVSMKSGWSMEQPVTFKDGNQSIEKRRVQQQGADSPGPSCVFLKSDWSMGQPVSFKDGRPSREERHQKRSKVTSAQSLQQHQTELIKRAEENAHAFLDKELKKLWRDLFSDYPQCSESQREEVEVEDGKKEEQRRRAIEGVVDITKLCLMEMNQEELADTLWGVSDAVEKKKKIKSHLRKKFRCVFEGIAKAGQQTDLNDFYTEIFITEGGSGEVNKEHENNPIWTDVTKSTSVDVLLTNLIRGVLSSLRSHLDNPQRPAAANQIPAECLTRKNSQPPVKINSTSSIRSAVDKALQTSRSLITQIKEYLLGQTEGGKKKTVSDIKKKIAGDLSPERSINLFHCLNELNDRSLVEEIQQSLTSGSLFKTHVSPAQWSALVFILLSLEEELDVFDLKEYSASEEGPSEAAASGSKPPKDHL
ncbi:unnamed protein product [Boreogadus saida]